jgi:hypothetical protein
MAHVAPVAAKALRKRSPAVIIGAIGVIIVPPHIERLTPMCSLFLIFLLFAVV